MESSVASHTSTVYQCVSSVLSQLTKQNSNKFSAKNYHCKCSHCFRL